MSSRADLQSKLEELLGTRNVYYQPPATLTMQYPAIVFSRKAIESRFANNDKYSKMNSYEIIVIDKRPDNPVIDALLELPYSSYDRHYNGDNLNHDVLTLYF